MPRKSNLTPENRKKTQFSKTNQPSGAAKSAGALKGKVGRELALAVLNLPVAGTLKRHVNSLLRSIGMAEEVDMTFEQALQIQKLVISLQSRSENVRLYAAELLANRAFGLPKQISEVTTYTPTVNVTVPDKETADEINKLK